MAMGEVGIIERKPVPCFKIAMKDFLRWSEGEHRAHPNTHKRYKTSSVALLRHFSDAALDRVTSDDVERFKTQRASEFKTVKSKRNRVQTKSRLRPATVNRELACLKALFNFAIKADVIAKNPVTKVKFLAENNQQNRVLSYKEQKAYLDNATPTLRDIATLILETGMRPEEVYSLQPENVNLVTGTLQIPRGKTPGREGS